MGRRSDHTREEIREMALAAAGRILDTEGAHKLTARNVAAEIGYTAGTLYLVFDNLDHIVLHLNQATMNALRDTMAEAARGADSPRQALSAMVRQYVRYAEGNRTRWQLLFAATLPTGRPIPENFQAEYQQLCEQVADCMGGDPSQARGPARMVCAGVQGLVDMFLAGRLGGLAVNEVEQMAETMAMKLFVAEKTVLRRLA